MLIAHSICLFIIIFLLSNECFERKILPSIHNIPYLIFGFLFLNLCIAISLVSIKVYFIIGLIWMLIGISSYLKMPNSSVINKIISILFSLVFWPESFIVFLFYLYHHEKPKS